MNNSARYVLCTSILICAIAAIGIAKKTGHRRNGRLRDSSSRELSLEWTELSECSRTCGGGVAHRDRICSMSTDSLCEAERKYFLCNTQNCPNGSEDFRDVQCRQFDNMDFGGLNFKWISYYGDENQCALNCLAEGQQFYRRLADKVVDGTPCDRNTLNVCIDGNCKLVGCDRVLGSKKVFDACLVCGGYGSTCKTEHGTIETQNMEPGYNQLVILPQGATSITIQEEGTSQNYFAVRNIDGVYYLNGDSKIAVAVPQHLGSTFFEYRRLRYGIEYLSAVGPLQETLIIEIIKREGITPSVRYDYSVVYNASLERTHVWIASAWSQCNASCGMGHLNRAVSCTNLATRRTVSAEFCDGLEKPSSTEICESIKCAAEWFIGVWQACSETCGNFGTQVRHVFCHRILPDGETEVVSENQCPQPKPEAIQSCNHGMACSEWVAGDWSQCFGTCGKTGEQTRAVRCIEKGQMSNILLDMDCELTERPVDRKRCELGPCLGFEWMASEWSGCDDGCSSTVETRQLKCSTKDGHIRSVSDCDDAKRPETTRPCPLDESCGANHHLPQWFTSQWSSCSASCGPGTQRRLVFCGANDSGHMTRMPSHRCDAETKLAEERKCTGTECFSVWFTGPFGKCSAACGGGQKRRELFCFIGNESVSLQNCDESSRPDVLQDCNQTPCDEDNSDQSGDSECRGSRYGCCPDQLTAADGPNYLGCASDPIPPGLCIDTEFGCCPDDITAAQGPFQLGCYIPRCPETRYGCCADGKTPASGPDRKGCEIAENALPHGCQQSLFGCCPDGVTTRTGVNGEGCYDKAKVSEDEYSGSGVGDDCKMSVYGCCPDGRTPAGGPNRQGCPDHPLILKEKIGGLHSNQLLTEQPSLTEFHISDSHVSNLPGSTLQSSHHYQHATPAFTDSAVTTSIYELVTSDVSATKIPPRDNRHVLDCHNSIHGCCSDGKTPAGGPNLHGCPEYGVSHPDICEFSSYGCCPDGVTPARGPNHARCPHLLKIAVTCSLLKDPGSCSDYSLRWYFDSTLGNCASFEYGGCGGNENRFDTRETCRQSCVNPEGLERCYLPQSSGRCYRSLIRYFYNPQSSKCEEFVYGGCLGNENRFSTMRDCEKSCVEPQKPDVCNQPALTGPCRAAFQYYYFDHKAGTCRQFIYGGCGGNENRFESLEGCEDRCGESLVQSCRLPRDPGPCKALFYQWYFSSETGQCEEFKYGGCLGNANRFRTKMECEKGCKRLLRKTVVDRCSISPETGSCRGYFPSWYYNNSDGYCKEFVYGGCGGNENRFESEPDCRKACDANLPIDVCTLPADMGPCRASFEKYYFDGEANQCLKFIYGGCDGNGNNFQSLEECQKRCSSHIVFTLSPGSSRCLLPRDVGPCVESMPRWHYSPLDRQCMKFEYGGCGGNLNRFLSESSCSAQCGHLAYVASIFTRTTESPHAAVDTDGVPVDIHHVSSAAPHEYDTVASTSPVQDPDVDWNESEVIPWHTEDNGDKVLPTSKEVHVEDNDVVPRTDLEENWQQVFESSLPDHHLPVTPLSWETPSVATEGARRETESPRIFDVVIVDETNRRPQKEEAGVDVESEHFYDGTKEESSGDIVDFPLEFTTASSTEHVTFSDVLLTNSKAAFDACTLHAEHGSCRNYTYWRWHYNQEIGECAQFKFGGCDGNANNFETQEECESHCPVKEICQLPSKVGPCFAAKKRYFFNTVLGVCQEFTYGGCKGNGNRFLALENCQSVCETLHRTSTETAQITPEDNLVFRADRPVHVDHEENVCNLPKETGPCRAYITSYYFDQEVSACLVFVWGGCGGNGNRFATPADCEKTCLHDNIASTLSSTTMEAPTKAAITATENVCNLPKETGRCKAYFPSYYFDPAVSACLVFVWGGCGGNGNRFATVADCEKTCLHDNMSFASTLSSTTTEASTKPAISSTVLVHTVPPASVRHFPESSLRHWDVCKIHKDPGPCDNYQVFWYFEPIGRHCRRFYYGGCGGNDNKYNSSEECHSRCLNFESSVKVPAIPREISATVQSATASATVAPVVAPSTLHSVVETTPHFQSSTEWSLDAPTFDIDEVAEGEPVVSRCDLPQDLGRHCAGWHEYWFHDSEFRKCRRFFYGGCDGNENRFATEDECAAACLEFTGDVSTAAFDVDICLEPKVTGPCTLSDVRWYFDESEGRCLNFTYGGCQGNRNNFETEKDCMIICKDHLKETEATERDVCSLPKDSGPCIGDFLRFYWSPADRECRPFTYGGCQGNDNNFVTQEECYGACRGSDGISQRKLLRPGDCFLPASAGPCRAAMPRWFYDSKRGDCSSFYYGGCHGNGNNFFDYEDCFTYCSKVSYACGVLQCDMECPYGYEQGPDSCPLCQCLDPCKDVTCPENSQCTVENVPCITSPCAAEYKTLCRTVTTKPGFCPAKSESDHNVVECSDECLTDENCPAELKCCQSGCSRLCRKPEPQEEAPVINAYPEVVTAVEHSDVFLDCEARGAPRPQVTWYRDGVPILHDGRQVRKAVVLTNDTLHIVNIEANDTKASYSCRAYNNIGTAVHTYMLIVNVPVKIKNEGETEIIEIVQKSNIQLSCHASGFPTPSVTWTKDGLRVFNDTNRRITDEGLLIIGVDLTDAGSYACRADNGVGNSKVKLYQIYVSNLMSVQIVTETTNVTAGDNVKLQCKVNEELKNVSITWQYNGRPLSSEFRFRVRASGELLIESIRPTDGGEYTCSATRGQEQSSASVVINIHARKLPEKCVDKPWYANCELIVEAKLCHHAYFSIFCCSTCHKAGLLP